MKKFALLILIGISSSLIYAQEIKKDEYITNGDTIEAKLYNAEGVLEQIGTYNKEGKLHGEWISYNELGEKTCIAQYESGKKVGTWKFYDGDILREVTYTDSKIAKVNTWQMKETRVVSNK